MTRQKSISLCLLNVVILFFYNEIPDSRLLNDINLMCLPTTRIQLCVYEEGMKDLLFTLSCRMW